MICKKKTKLLLIPMLACSWLFTQAQQSEFDAQRFFAPDFYTHPGNSNRSASGAPGQDYWQNRADYKLNAILDTTMLTLTGNEIITYTNNSPDHLTVLWLQLDQNIYKKYSRSDYTRSLSGKFHTDGYTVRNLKLQQGKETPQVALFTVTDTRMQITLHKPLAPGKQIKIMMDYEYIVPAFGGRTDYFQSQNGKVFEIAQWYPRMCVYDDLHGWNTLPFLGTGEFYCEYGDFDYSVTLPSNMIVGGSGELINKKEVLTPEQVSRLNQAQQSNKTIMIRTVDEVMSETSADHENPKSPTKTWHFRMRNTRDVAFVASAAYVWDAAKINLPQGKSALAMSLYPVESAGPDAWDRSTEYTKAVIEHFSQKWVPYPYPVAINIAGRASGMEYPGIFFEGINWKGKTLFAVSAHEIGHTWFPMMVGSNERRHAWMDEGINTFIDIFASEDFNQGEYAPKRDGEYAPGGGNPADEIVPLLQDPDAPSMMLTADMITGKYRHPVSYFKPAFGLVLLRDVILGHERFDLAFKQYIHKWSYKHPAPDDFFRTMESESGEDLTWFWRGWFHKNWEFDVSIQSVENGQINLFNRKKMAFPCTLSITYTDGTNETLRLPIEVWMNGPNYQVQVNENKEIASVVIDPDHQLPDSDRSNNIWKSN